MQQQVKQSMVRHSTTHWHAMPRIAWLPRWQILGNLGHIMTQNSALGPVNSRRII